MASPTSATSAPPVVWCSADPTSANSKPIAFALHGIELHGNLTERQVLALRELVAAAAEGRLLIPADGATVQLDCGISIGSAIVRQSEPSQPQQRRMSTTSTSVPAINTSAADTASAADDQDCDYRLYTNQERRMRTLSTDSTHVPPKPKQNCITIESLFSARTFTSDKTTVTSDESPIAFQSTAPEAAEELYEFLCCAKCMNDRSLCNQPPAAKFPVAKHPAPAAVARHRHAIEHVTYVTNRYLRKFTMGRSTASAARKVQLKSLKRPKFAVRAAQSSQTQLASPVGPRVPLYATVHKAAATSTQQHHHHHHCGVLNGNSNAPIVKDLHSPPSLLTLKSPFARDNHHNHVANHSARSAERLSKDNETNACTAGTAAASAERRVRQQQQQRSNNTAITAAAATRCRCPRRAPQCQATTVTTLASAWKKSHEIDGSSSSSNSSVEKKSITAKINDIGTAGAAALRAAAPRIRHRVTEAALPIAMAPSDGGHHHHATLPASTDEDVLPLLASSQSASSSRKTSFDSSCTEHGSTDSGFIEMQIRLEANLGTIATGDRPADGDKCTATTEARSTAAERRRATAAEARSTCNVFTVPMTTMPVSASDDDDNVADDDDDATAVVGDKQHVDNDDDQLLRLPLLPNVKSCLAQQSKNRRKSYEEFKATFQRQQHNVASPSPVTMPAATVKQVPLLCAGASPVDTRRSTSADTASTSVNVKSRRKSYEEFKRMVRESDTVEQKIVLQRKNSKRTSGKLTHAADQRRALIALHAIAPNSAAIIDEEKVIEAITTTASTMMTTATTNAATLTSTTTATSSATQSAACGAIYDILQRRVLKTIAGDATTPPATTMASSFGTLYDIVQKKSIDLGHRYDHHQSMTYGTLYEILQRKTTTSSSASSSGHSLDTVGDGFQRKRALSEKFIKRSAVGTDPKYNTMHFGTIYDILQRQHQVSAAQRVFQLPQLGGGGGDVDATTKKTRFSVKKVPEDALPAAEPLRVLMGLEGRLDEYSEPQTAMLTKVKKCTRLRRFSNILSYNPKPASAALSSTLSPPFAIEPLSIPSIREDADVETPDTSNPAAPAVHATPAPRRHVRKHGVQQCNQPDVMRRLQQIEASEQRTAIEAADSQRTMSIWTRKALWRKDKSRRLSEFTRGEFLNEKA